MIAPNTCPETCAPGTCAAERGHVVNSCKLCAPLGASLAYKGVKGCVPLVHGSQGCATYIRRYLISHFREPVDIASSNFSESSAVFGGLDNFHKAIDNIASQYSPELVGVASTCLSETIGDDLPMFVSEHRKARPDGPCLVCASTPSYHGTHMDGFHAVVKALVAALAAPGPKGKHVNIFPGFVSPADLRHLKDLLASFELPYVMVPDYSETLDGPNWDTYHRVPEGGVSLDALRLTGSALASIEFGSIPHCGLKGGVSAAEFLEQSFGVEAIRLPMPIGIDNTDALMKLLAKLSGASVPDAHRRERGRLVDAYVDSHKYLQGKRAAVFGDEDMVAALSDFLSEVGVEPILCASGGESGALEAAVSPKCPGALVLQGADHDAIDRACERLKPDLLVGSSRGYQCSRKLGIPLIRMGFPVHDRLGAQRIRHLGYTGAQELLDRVANALVEHKQNASPVGYKYI